MYEYPPILTGGTQQQLTALRDYLVRLARSLESENALATSGASINRKATGAAGNAAVSGESGTELTASDVRALIVKNAGRVERLVERTERGLREEYLALSDFGSYLEQIEQSIEAGARATIESYRFDSRLDALAERAEESESLLRTLRGEIRRGLITDPETGETAMGIAIAEQLSFTGEVHEDGGLQYYELSPGQTLGLYTATGWQFWVNGCKRGWFDASDGGLHTIHQTVDSELRMGGWTITPSGGLGLRRDA